MKIPLIFLAMVAGTTSLTLLAGEEKFDANTIRAWVSEGRILPLQQILESPELEGFGRVLDIEVERENGHLVYELKLLDQQGRRHKFYMDAETGKRVWPGDDYEHYQRSNEDQHESGKHHKRRDDD